MDALSLLFDLGAGFILLIIILVGIAFLRALFRSASPHTNQTQSSTIERSSDSQYDQIEENIREDSEGDGLMLFDDPLFPPEFDESDSDDSPRVKATGIQSPSDKAIEEIVTMRSARNSFADILELERKGSELERAGKLDDASKVYLELVEEGFNGSFPFDRLRIIYAKQKRWADAADICKRYVALDAGYAGYNVKSKRMVELARKYESRANNDTDVLTADLILKRTLKADNLSLKKRPLAIPNYRINQPFPSWAQGEVKLEIMPVPPFKMYFPSENHMSSLQSDFYVQWKYGWQQGKPVDVQGNISYLFVYTYGVISSITLKPQETIDELRLLQHVYKKEPKFCMYLSFWIFNAYLMQSDCLMAIAYLESRESPEKVNSSDRLILSLKYKLGLPAKGDDIINLSSPKSKIILNNKDLILPLLDKAIEDFEEKNDVDLLSLVTQKFAFLESSEYNLFPGQSAVRAKVKFNIYNYSALGDFKIVLNQWLADAENKVRVQLKLPKIGEGWVSESMVLNLANNTFNPLGYDVIHNSFPAFLNGLQLDIYVPSLKLAIEYMGKQHYEPIDFFGGQESYLKLRQRDERKMKLCTENGVHLIYYKFDEPLNESYFKSKIEQYLN